jgi:hypothetical protein
MPPRARRKVPEQAPAPAVVPSTTRAGRQRVFTNKQMESSEYHRQILYMLADQLHFLSGPAAGEGRSREKASIYAGTSS